MAHITLITGGCRSGKSSHAQKTAEAFPAPRLYVATCPPVDDEMEARIRRHREGRAPEHWHTVEETLDIASALRGAPGYGVVLVDCLALWVSNLMYAAELENRSLTEEDVAEHCREVLAACADPDARVVFVTNEVGMGIVPENEVARRYRDLLGRCNQVMAAGAQTVILMSCGIPLILKGNQEDVSAR